MHFFYLSYRNLRFLILCFALASLNAFSQTSVQPDAAGIKLGLKKLNFLGSVLYIAAHPDDENTRVIAYLSNEQLAATGYLSITRGDGGQNLIGPEIQDQLGIIRTQELLAARKIDKGEQFFTRARDFGYSKNPEETFQIWDKQKILSDVVRTIRKFQPDIIITRFPVFSTGGHGHHTASAILAQEAFDLAADPKAYPDQIKKFGLWQPTSLYLNTGRWWNPDINENQPGVITLDIGTYSPLLGEAYSEMAAKSRTQHKSQGFGSEGQRGTRIEFFEPKKGYAAKKTLFERVNTTWTRVTGGNAVQPLVKKLIDEFDEENPAASIPTLLAVRKQLSTLQESVWKIRKLAETDRLIQHCLGLYLEVTADRYYAPQGEALTCSFELVNRSAVPVTLKQVSSVELNFDSTFNTTLLNNKPLIFNTTKNIDTNQDYSSPYWLKKPHTLGHFIITNKALIGTPENKPAISYTFECDVEGTPLLLNIPLMYKWTDPVKGKQTRPFSIVPPLSVNIAKSVWVFNSSQSNTIKILVKSHSNKAVRGTLKLKLPQEWQSKPSEMPFMLLNQGDENALTFTVYPPKEEMVSSLHVEARIDDRVYHGQSMEVISYDHIPTQTFITPTEAKLVRINLKKEGSLIGYIKGAGDEIPVALRNMGYEVLEMQNDEITPENLNKLDAVVLGIRAINTNERIPFFMDNLLRYTRKGGVLIVQYNTNRRLKIPEDKFAPYPLSLSRIRVTDEHSEVTIITPNHPALNFPNTITNKDFEGWVHERGLYFPQHWDDHFKPLFSMHDDGEAATKGALIIAQYGKGYYIYTGLSFFRQLPEGVPGAYKLFANLVSMGTRNSGSKQGE